MKRFSSVLVVLLAQCLWVSAARPATYYVDFQRGDDTAAGTTPESPFKHAPGDPAAEGRAAATELASGDRVVFKGGQIYRGSLVARWSGREGEPIIYDGNTEGTFGSGPAILDGGELVTGWRRCTSAEDAGGNANWRHLYTATVPAAPDRNALSAGLTQGERMLYPAQYPNPDDPFYSGNIASYLVLDAAPSRTSLADPRLAEIGEANLVGAYVFIRTVQNFVEFRRITAWDAESNTVHYGRTNRQPINRYSIVNSLHSKVLDGPGQYVYVEPPEADGRHRIYIWPWDNQDPAASPITTIQRDFAIDFGDRGTSHVVVQGFKIQNYRAGIRGRGRGDDKVEGVRIRHNEITRICPSGDGSAVNFVNVRDYRVSGNHIHHCPRSNAIQTRIGENVVYSDNTVRMVARSPLRFYDIQHGQIIDNVVVDCRGVHSNPLTIYVGCTDILVARNEVHRSNIGMTLQNADRIYVINNIFTSEGGSTIGLWPGHPTRNYVFLNNFIGLSKDAFFVNAPNAENFVIKNNIITGIGGYPLGEGHTLSHNLYLGPWKGYHTGEFSVDRLRDVVADPSSYDFKTQPTSPAVDMGVDVSEYYPRETFPDFDFDVDFAGNPRIHGAAIDIGPFEVAYPPGALDDRPEIPTGSEAEATTPLDAFTRIAGAPHIVVSAIEFSGEGGGRVRLFEPEELATTSFVRFWDREGHWLEYEMDAPETGDYDIALRYAAQFPAQRQVHVNGEVARGLESVELEPTGGWSAWRTVELPAKLRLNHGKNTIRLTSLGGRGVNLDEMRLSRAGRPDIVTTAGAFTDQGGYERLVEVVPSPRHGLFRFWNAAGHWLEWTLDDARPGAYEVVLRYATLANSPRQISVNGTVVPGLEHVLLDRTAGWHVCREASLPAPVVLREGRNVLRITSLGGAGMNLDEIRFIPVKAK